MLLDQIRIAGDNGLVLQLTRGRSMPGVSVFLVTSQHQNGEDGENVFYTPGQLSTMHADIWVRKAFPSTHPAKRPLKRVYRLMCEMANS